MSAYISSTQEEVFLKFAQFNAINPRLTWTKDEHPFDLVLKEIMAVEDGTKLVSFHSVPLIDSYGQEKMEFLLSEVSTTLQADCFFISPCTHVVFYDPHSELSVLAKDYYTHVSFARFKDQVLHPMVSWVLFGLIAGYTIPQIQVFVDSSETPDEAWRAIRASLPQSLY